MSRFRLRRGIPPVVSAILLVLLVAAPASAQEAAGDWYGVMEVGAAGLRITLHVTATDSGYAATLDSPDQGAMGVPLSRFRVEDGIVEFTFAAAGLTYDGRVDPDYTKIDGTFRQAGQSFPLVFGRTPLEAPRGSTGWAAERLEKTEVYVPMRDGVRLFTSYYVPKDTTRTYPIIMIRTPYNAEPGGEEAFSRYLTLYPDLIEDGYILAFQDVRGRYMSEGEFVDVRPYDPDKRGTEIDESSDTWDTIEWLVQNVPRNNGRVGIMGVSYPGFYATMSLLDAHPALEAVSPQAPVTDWFIGDDFHHNGAFFLIDAFSFYSSFGRPRPEPTRQRLSGYAFPSQDSYEFFLELGPLEAIEEEIFGDSIAFWSQMMDHPDYDAWWRARSPLPHLTDVGPAVLVVGGWFDAEDLWGALSTYEAIEEQNPPSAENRMMMGPWSHGQWAFGTGENLGNVHWFAPTSEHYRSAERRFFAHYLKGEGELELPEASVYDTGALEWHGFPAWPPPGARRATLWLQPEGGLSFEPPTASDSWDEYVSDPDNPVPYTEDVHLRRTAEYMTDDQRFASRRPDVVEYETEPLTEPVTLAGPLVADLVVSTTGTDADWVVKLIDVFPDSLREYPENEKRVPMAGYQMLVRAEVLRGRYRNSFERPEPFTPGEPTKVRFEIPDIFHTFRPGHRIMVQVQSSWFPLVDRNPQTFVNIYEADADDFRKAMHRIYHDAVRPSGVEVRVLDRR